MAANANAKPTTTDRNRPPATPDLLLQRINLYRKNRGDAAKALETRICDVATQAGEWAERLLIQVENFREGHYGIESTVMSELRSIRSQIEYVETLAAEYRELKAQLEVIQRISDG